jgi:hypothetical protein
MFGFVDAGNCCLVEEVETVVKASKSQNYLEKR